VKVVVEQGRHRHQQKPGRVEQMIRSQLRDFIDQVIDNQRIAAEDIKHLRRTVLEDGLSSREEAEALLALDRCLETDESWRETLVALMVDFVVWGSRPTGYVTAEDSRWLARALDVGGSSETALQVAYAIVEEAQQVDETLLGFILRGRQRASHSLAA
jgi:hypothetical protein